MKRVVLALLLPSLLLPVVLLPALLLPTLLLPAANATASEAPFERSEQRSPCTDYNPLRRAFFGDTHVHTALSFDAWGQGTMAGPGDAYRFARGEALGIQPYSRDGLPSRSIQLRRPLDFAIVTDHSDLLGETRICDDPSQEGHDSLVCRVVRRFPKLGYILVNGHVYSSELPSRYSFCGSGGAVCLKAALGPWQEIQQAAEAHYDRSSACGFTTFVGYEWTGMPGGRNIHRNVIFRNATAQRFPTTYIETPTQEGLWQALDQECLQAGNGCDVLAIPHNSNVSAGSMFTITSADGSPISAEDAATRARLETLVEVTQHKGDSECRPGAEDELCAYETLPYARMADMAHVTSEPGKLPPLMYTREVLAEGLVQQARLGINPFKFGLIGSTDTHLAAPGMVDEDSFVGHAAGTVDSRLQVPAFPDRAEFNPGGLAVLWAEENSRDALFAAMRRREVYGTSGPRMTVRMFAGWDYPDDLCGDSDFVEKGYAGGVPMGGDLPAARGPGAPKLALWALRDPAGKQSPSHPLERIQIVKGYLDNGRSVEKVYDVAGEPADPDALDLSTCTTRARGSDQLCTVWTDPDFDPDAPAFYYARVLEVPSCRWNSYLCNRAGVDCDDPDSVPGELATCCDTGVARSIRERAWTSPVWYTPAGQP
ncbi:MAG TPA: DUF3604 domain-containing protein [candidate division UBP10 bacterium]|nr:DUF3604 domain-containing protein [Candidatus Binatota bacterium]